MSPETVRPDPETLATMQQGFLEALPRIQRIARFRLRHLCGERKDEAVAETVALAWNAYRRLFLTGRDVAPLVGKIAEFSARQVCCGRQLTGTRIRDVLSPVPRHDHLVEAIPFSDDDDADPEVVDALQDRRHSDPAEEAALRVDVNDWLDGLDDKQRQVAKELAGGLNTTDVARLHRVSRTRIWQRREELKESWDRLHEEESRSARKDEQ
jgi:DNA-directed RNA polymerase specialized sigma24 family protein